MDWQKHVDKMMVNFTSREFQGFVIISVILLLSAFRMLLSDTLYGFEAFKFIAELWLWAFGIYSGIRTVQKLKEASVGGQQK